MNEDESNLYDLAPATPPVAGGGPRKSAAPGMGTDTRENAAPVPLSYRSSKDDGRAFDHSFPNKILDFYAPLWLIGGAVVIELIATLLFSGTLMSLPTAFTRMGVDLIFTTAIMLCAVLLTARMRGIQLGPFWAAVLKLAAVSVAPSAAMMLLAFPLDFIPFGIFIVWILGFCFYFALLGAFFDLDQSDTWACVIAIFAARVLVVVLIWQLLKK